MELFLFSASQVFVSCTLRFCCLVHTHLELLCLPCELILLSLYNVSLPLVIFFSLKTTFSNAKRATTTLFDKVYVTHLMPPFCFHLTYAIKFEGSFLWTEYSLVILFYLLCSICFWLVYAYYLHLISVCISFTFKDNYWNIST